MEQQASTSKVTVEYFDPHDVYKLLAPGLIPRLPLHNLHWQSHAGPLRSIDSLHIDLVRGDTAPTTTEPPAAAPKPADTNAPRDDGFQTQAVGGQTTTTTTTDISAEKPTAGKSVGPRRHQIPGLRHTPYLKVLLVRCDDNDSYKSSVRAEIREWLKTNTPPSSGSKKASNQENHDAYEWLIVHVVLPNTIAATQQRSSSKSDGVGTDKNTTSRWRPGTTPLLEKLKSDFNSSSKGSPDHIAQIRIGINDVPYDLLPRVVPAVPSGYSESELDAERAWDELMNKLKSLILNSFDQRVTQYEDDIKERDGQRTLPGWNFCTFFILKEGLARGFQNVGLVEDALVGYDELNVGLDLVLSEQQETGSPESHGGALLTYTDELRDILQTSLHNAGEGKDGDEAVDFAAQGSKPVAPDQIPISPIKKAYRDMILENKVSVFDFRCYIFSRQIALLLRLANTSFTREQLLSRLKEQQESILHGVAPLARATPQKEDETEDLNVLAEICKRALEFIPAVSAVMRQDLSASLNGNVKDGSKTSAPSQLTEESIDNIVVSFAFSVTQQILAQTATKSLPIPTSTVPPIDGQEPKSIIPEPKTMMHPARNSSLNERSPRLPQSPSFPGPGQALPPGDSTQFLKPGLEDLAAGRAELYLMSRNILRNLGQKRGWTNGWAEAPLVNDGGVEQMEEISLDDGRDNGSESEDSKKNESSSPDVVVSAAGVQSHVLNAAIDNPQDFYRLYEILTDKAMRHYTVANQEHAVETSLAELAVMKYHLKEFRAAASYFFRTTRFFGEEGWSMIELSMLIMYARCVRENQSKEDFVYVALKLLTMACAAEKAHRDSSLVGRSSGLDLGPVKEVVSQLFESSSSLKADVKAPIASFFDKVQLTGTPTYDDERDSCNVTVSLHSLLPDEFLVDHIKLHATNTDESAVIREVIFESTSTIGLKPGKNTFQVKCNSVIPGYYTIGNMSMRCGKIILLYEKNSRAVSSPEYFLKHREVTLFQRANALDVALSAAKHTTHDGTNSLDLVLSTGWNTIKRCEIRIKPATGGLRLLTTESKLIDSAVKFSRAPEAGLFVFDDIPENTSVTIQFPFTVETDLRDVLAKVEVKYNTSDATFNFAKNFTTPVSLVLGVNVQDVFKHQALFSRFNVSTSIDGPLRLYKSELLSTELYESSFGASPKNTVLVFPKQPAHLLYKVHRTSEPKSTTKTAKVMYLKLHYRTVHDEIEHLICQSIQDALAAIPTLQLYSKHILASVTKEIKVRLQPHDLERAALLSHITTVFLNDVPWEKYFVGIGPDTTTAQLTQFLQTWQSSQPKLPLTEPTTEPPSILIPVEIPSVTIVHTADIRLQTPIPSPVNNPTGAPVVSVNQVLVATLHLKWTRVWDIETAQRDDLEFSFDVTAPTDTWLIGGRRKGHFVISGRASTNDDSSLSSSPETEAEIPLVLIPLRPGWLPYPLIEIREIKGNGQTAEQGSPHGCEVDWRNLGETIQVIGDRSSVTLSLDASGPTGGPLVFESEQMQQSAGVRIVA